jgi:hypothetical protein
MIQITIPKSELEFDSKRINCEDAYTRRNQKCRITEDENFTTIRVKNWCGEMRGQGTSLCEPGREMVLTMIANNPASVATDLSAAVNVTIFTQYNELIATSVPFPVTPPLVGVVLTTKEVKLTR